MSLHKRLQVLTILARVFKNKKYVEQVWVDFQLNFWQYKLKFYIFWEVWTNLTFNNVLNTFT